MLHRPLTSALLGSWLVLGPMACARHDADDAPADDTPVGGETDVDTDSDAAVDPTDTPEDTDTDPGTADTGGPPMPFGPVATGFVDLTPDHVAFPLDLEPGRPADGVNATSSAGFFADIDGDGVIEVVFTVDSPGGTGSGGLVTQVWEWTEAGLVHDDVTTAWLAGVGGPPRLATDLDGDGHMDVVFTTPRNGLRRGSGPGALAPPDPQGPAYAEVGATRGAVSIADVDADGRLDVIAADGRCRPGAPPWWLLLQDVPGVWTQVDDIVPLGLAGQPWAVGALPDEQGDPVLLALGHPCDFTQPFPGFATRTGWGEDGRPRYTLQDPSPAEAIYRNDQSIQGGPLTLLNPMGASLIDTRGDGTLDLWLGTSHTWLVGLRGFGSPAPTDATWLMRRVWPPYLLFGWTPHPVDLDRDGLPDLLMSYGDDSAAHPSFTAGPKYLRAYWSDGDGGFVDASRAVGLGMPGNHRSITAGDPDQDGDLDLIVGGFGVPPVVYRNDLPGRALTVVLRGTTSNRLGLGARLQRVDGASPGAVHVVGDTLNTDAWTEPVTEIGLGTDTVLGTLRITWPSGHIQEVHDLQAGRLHVVEEPVVVELLPSRRAPADGSTNVAVQVTARLPDGTPRTDATVAIRFATPTGQGTWTGGVTRTGNRYRRTLRAPATPGRDVLEIEVDGRVWPLRPHVTWTAPP